MTGVKQGSLVRQVIVIEEDPKGIIHLERPRSMGELCELGR